LARSQFFSFLATKDHFSSNWTSRVRGGKSDQFVVEVASVFAGDPAVAADSAAIRLAEPSGLSDAAPLGDVLQDRFDFLLGEPRVEQRCPLPLGEAGLAGTTAEHASALVWPIAAGHGQISGSPFAMFGAVGIQAAEAREVVHGAAPPARCSRRYRGYVMPYEIADQAAIVQ
jgi:hypothetical protein